jgi:hypothetical protein
MARRIAVRLLGGVAVVLLFVFIVSFFLDGIVRPHIERTMNANLKGYSATVPYAHLQLVGLTLTLRDLTILQKAHPRPPIAIFPTMRFQIEWKALMFGRVAANVLLEHPKLHINVMQLSTERKDPTPLRQKGWQEALQNVYPFKINRFVVDDGDLLYVERGQRNPLHLSGLSFVSDNIRNISEPQHRYPSWFRARMVIFNQGKMLFEGKANYLMTPFPGIQAHYTVTNVPLDPVTTASHHVNVTISGGTFDSNGFIEYSPAVTNIDVDKTKSFTTNMIYTHRSDTQHAEAKRADVAGKEIKKETNRRTVNISLHELDVEHSKLAFDDQDSTPPFTLFIDDTDLKLKNLANHSAQHPAQLALNGRFMGSGETEVAGTIHAYGQSPEVNLNIKIQNTDMTSLNPLLRAYGRFDVAQGYFTLYSQLAIADGILSGYVKPMFSDLKVYDYQKDKNKGVLAQGKQMLIGAAGHVFKNRQTQKVATQIPITGSLKKPNVSAWEAFVEIVDNAFVQAILPGFDRAVQNPTGG